MLFFIIVTLFVAVVVYMYGVADDPIDVHDGSGVMFGDRV